MGLLKMGHPSARPGDLYELAESLQLAGNSGEAKKTFAEFETKALTESGKRDNANRELVFYYIDHAHQLAKALKIAEQEYAWRHDVYTVDAYAWALNSNGQDVEARKRIETALAVGIRDARIFRHAGLIALKSGDRLAGERYLKLAAELNSEDAAQARTILASLAGNPGGGKKSATGTRFDGNMKKRSVSWWLLLVLLPLSLSAQSIVLKGRVTDAQGNALPGASILLLGQDHPGPPQVLGRTTSGPAGGFDLKTDSKGTFDLQVDVRDSGRWFGG